MQLLIGTGRYHEDSGDGLRHPHWSNAKTPGNAVTGQPYEGVLGCGGDVAGWRVGRGGDVVEEPGEQHRQGGGRGAFTAPADPGAVAVGSQVQGVVGEPDPDRLGEDEFGQRPDHWHPVGDRRAQHARGQLDDRGVGDRVYQVAGDRIALVEVEVSNRISDPVHCRAGRSLAVHSAPCPWVGSTNSALV
ncbi:hypothetical protein [Nocardia asteroides]|uniref:hypothetical protein n=1 Tax=Nocardia asteroides TaxID=1824 RepID=UPI001E45C6BE|nr:hypothetical protein [Nocardia asteroides]UGT61798.1 hypothetical protein LTT61_00105 [Nocardia asteroides]